MRIAAVTMVCNEALLLPYFLRHYEYLDEIHVLYETDSTDDTLKILEQASNVVIKDCHIEGGFDDIEKVAYMNDTLPTIGADWIYVVDCDEFIFPPQESPQDFLGRQDRENYNVVRAGMFQVYRHRTDKDLDPSLPPIPQRLHGDPDLFSTTEGPNTPSNIKYIKPIVVKPSSGIRFQPGNHAAQGDMRVSPELYLGAHWQMADPAIAIDRRMKNKARMSERNKKLGLGYQHWGVTEEWIRAECDRHLDDPLIWELYLLSQQPAGYYHATDGKHSAESTKPWGYPICYMPPNRITLRSGWHEHIPFAMFLVDILRPKVIVELGTYYGDSYCAFCQAVKELRIDAVCRAIDTWEGDPHTGSYGSEILEQLRMHHDSLYGNFSRLIQSTFDDALDSFGDGTVDLLHIDGYHGYEAVKHDFETWLPKMSAHGIVLLHDTSVKEPSFGVWRLWEDVKQRYPHFAFQHGHGLGVLAVGKEYPREVRSLFNLDEGECAAIRDFFFQRGAQLEERARVKALFNEIREKNHDIAELRASVERLEPELNRLRESIPMQLVNRYQRIVERLLRQGSRRRRLYELVLSGIRVVLNEGWRSFFGKLKARLPGGKAKADKQQ